VTVDPFVSRRCTRTVPLSPSSTAIIRGVGSAPKSIVFFSNSTSRDSSTSLGMTNCRKARRLPFDRQPRRLPYNDIAFIIRYENPCVVCANVVVAVQGFSSGVANAAIACGRGAAGATDDLQRRSQSSRIINAGAAHLGDDRKGIASRRLRSH
jgi:hypothetical protein